MKNSLVRCPVKHSHLKLEVVPVNQIRFDVSMLSDICFRILSVRCSHYRGTLLDFQIKAFGSLKLRNFERSYFRKAVVT